MRSATTSTEATDATAPRFYKLYLIISKFQGYARPLGSPLCEDIDECALGLHNCGAEQICQNFPGYFQCLEREDNIEKPELVEAFRFEEENSRASLRHAIPLAFEERDEVLVGQEMVKIARFILKNKRQKI